MLVLTGVLVGVVLVVMIGGTALSFVELGWLPAPRHALHRPDMARRVVRDLLGLGDARRAGARRSVRDRLLLRRRVHEGQATGAPRRSRRHALDGTARGSAPDRHRIARPLTVGRAARPARCPEASARTACRVPARATTSTWPRPRWSASRRSTASTTSAAAVGPTASGHDLTSDSSSMSWIPYSDASSATARSSNNRRTSAVDARG